MVTKKVSTTKKVAVLKESPATKKGSGLGSFMDNEALNLLSEVEEVVKLNSITFGEENRMHTGLLCLDLMTGGGIVPGFYTFTGPEQSAKTTAAVTISGASTKVKELRIRTLWDAENSSGNSLDYIANIYETLGYKASVDQLFGVRGQKGWVVPPIIEYKDDSSGDTFFNWLYSVAKRLPDKRFNNGRWWYVYKSTNENKAKFKEYIDRTQTSKNEGLWIPAVDGSLQALVICDSFPSLVPAAMDDEDASNAMAVQARMFSKHLPRVKGAFRAKRIALIGINQLRLNPGVRYGSPEYEPGGEALKFFSDVRFRFKPRALSGVPFHPKGDGGLEKEPSVDNTGEDTYRYINVSMIKNKLSPHVREMWLRLWVADKEGEGRGFDPVWDTFYFGVMTGQITGKKSQMKLHLIGLGEARVAIAWKDFKTLVIGEKESWEPIYKRIGYKVVNLRLGFLSQITKGKAIPAYFEILNSKKLKSTDAEKDEDADEDAD